MLSITDLKTGTKFSMEGDPYIVISYSHSKMGRGGAVVKTKIKNLRSGSTVDKTFQGADKVDEADLAKREAMYLYSDEADAYFMNNETFDQFTIPLSKIGNQKQYLMENTNIEIIYYEDEPLNIELPIKMKFKVTSAPPAVRGNSAGAITKRITLETGTMVDAPIFIKDEDYIILDTRDNSYVERAS